MRDPAILLYKDKWLIATKGMRADAKGWYLNLIIYQHDIGSLPNDIEELANLCDVRISEFEQFKQVFEQVLKQKFEVNSENRLENSFAREIIKNRETFKEKRSDAGKLSYVLKYFRANFKYKHGFEEWFKKNVIIDFDIKNEQVLKQVFKQNFELYINVNVNINNIEDNNVNYIINEVSSFFDKKYINDDTKKVLFKLLNSYTKEQIIDAVKWAKNDSFWSSNFLSLNKLNTTDKNKVKYIDIFISKMGNKNNLQFNAITDEFKKQSSNGLIDLSKMYKI
jgi:hypothetical protein